MDAGVTLFDTAALYGFGANEEVVGRALRSRRDEVVLASKCGMTGVNGKRVIDGRPDTIRQTCDQALIRLGVDVIDLYYLHRVDRSVRIEDSVGALGQLVAGKVRAIGLSEVSAATLRRAHQVHPIAAVQNEYSLWSRNPELGPLSTTRELGIALVAFSPLGRGRLTSSPPSSTSLLARDIRRNMPRFDAANYPRNLFLRQELARLAASAGCTLAQLALVWVLSRGSHVLAIPGTRWVDHLSENIAALHLHLDAGVLDAADKVHNAQTVSGKRYNDATLAEIDTETFHAAG